MLITTTVPPFTLLHTLKCVFIPVNLSLGVAANICQTVWLTTIKNLTILLEGSMSFKMHTQKGGGVGGHGYVFLESRDKHVLCSPRQQSTLEFTNPAE